MIIWLCLLYQLHVIYCGGNTLYIWDIVGNINYIEFTLLNSKTLWFLLYQFIVAWRRHTAPFDIEGVFDTCNIVGLGLTAPTRQTSLIFIYTIWRFLR